MEDLNALVVKRWAFLRLDLESRDYHAPTAQSFGKLNTPNQNCLEERLNGIVRHATLLHPYAVEYLDGVLPIVKPLFEGQFQE